MTQEDKHASQATASSFPMSSPAFWQAAAEVEPVAGPSRPAKRVVRFQDDEARIAPSSPQLGTTTTLNANDFYASDDEEDAAIRRREQANKEYLMNPEYAPNKFGDIGDYMRKKDIKVQTQFRDLATEAEGSVPQIFKGYVFHINGNVEPPLEILRKLILHRGGIILPVLRRKTSVTHIIAPVLPPSKHVAFAEYKVVKPTWIVASVEANQVLDWRRWKLVPTGGELESAQKGMDRFLAKGASQNPAKSSSAKEEDTIPITTLPIPPRPPDPVLPGHDSIGMYEEDVNKPSTPIKKVRQADGTPGVKVVSDPRVGEIPKPITSPTTPIKHSTTAKPKTLTDTDASLPGAQAVQAAQVSSRPKDAVATRPKQPYKNPWANYFKFEENPDAQRLMKDDAWQQKHTAQAGNDFIDGYYQNSRLHHLSTWKAELKVLVSAAQREAETAPKPQLPDTSADTLSLSTSVLPRVDSPARANLNKAEGKVIMHVDFDAFFVSCGLALRPELKGKPTVVCHSQGRQGTLGSTSEIASCSYEARAKGVKNGMSLGRAREMCPGIVTIPYEFETYKKFSIAFYTILMGYADDLEAVSVDEALIDATSAVRSLRCAPDEEGEMPLHIRRAYGDGEVFSASPDNQENLDSLRPRDWAVEVAQKIRDDVRAATGCEVSIGISHNILLAKLATRHAKPAGIHHLLPAAIPSFIAPLDVDDFPSFGYSMKRKIQERLGTTNCGELLKQSKYTLKEVCGPKNGETLYGFLRGEDDRQLEAHKERKSVSAEVNYGIRFQNQTQAEDFLVNLSGEVSNRLRKLHTKGKALTLKIMSRHPDAPVEAPKFMGHGVCETFNKSVSISDSRGAATDDAATIAKESIKLLRAMSLDPTELRGIGMQVVKLEAEGLSHAQPERPKDQPALDFKILKAKQTIAVEDATSFPSVDEPPLAAAQVSPRRHQNEPTTAITPTEKAASFDIDPTFLDAMPPSLRQEVEREIASRGSRSASRAMSEIPSAPAYPSNLPTRATTKSPAKRPASERNPAAHITKQLRPNVKTFLPTKVLAEQPLFKIRKKRAITPVQEDDVIDLTNTPSKRPRFDQPKIGAYRVDRLEELGFDLEWFSALPPDMQDEQVQEREQQNREQSSRAARPELRALEKATNQCRSVSASISPSKDRARSASAGPLAPPIAVTRLNKPTLSKKHTTDDILDVITSWVGAGHAKGPEAKDAARVLKYLGKCLDISQAGHAGFGDACVVLAWWKSLLEESWPEKEGEAGKKWWATWQQAASECNEVSLKRFRAPMKL